MLSGDLARDGAARARRGRGGAERRRARALPAGAADARLDRARRRGGARRLRGGVGRVEARRDPHPDPPPRRRGADLHAQPERDHRRCCRRRRRASAPSRSSRRCSTARRSRWGATGPRAFQDTVAQIDARRSAGRDRHVPVRRAAPRRRRPARYAAPRARRARSRRSRASSRSRACSPPTPARRSGCSTRRWRPATRASS